ncbi:hypothetical protein RA269_27715, partial [Pseudomonas syringae pv. tagetis]|uniref:hypothetical protein n=1 Tax=Pseudomonas syringae group genomosp. 7 TaxID=251699 RepID=UPI00376FAA6B
MLMFFLLLVVGFWGLVGVWWCCCVFVWVLLFCLFVFVWCCVMLFVGRGGWRRGLCCGVFSWGWCGGPFFWRCCSRYR